MAKKILMVGSEMVPYASTGGLGDVLGSLPFSCASICEQELDIRVIMPLYGEIKEKYFKELTFLKEITVPLSWRKAYCGIYRLTKDKVTIYFVDNEYYFKRPSLYGSYDDGERFAYFGSAVMNMLEHIDFIPDILHAHDWQSAMSVIYLKTVFSSIPEYKNIKAIFTIHNVAYQGKYDAAILGDVFGLDTRYYSLLENDGCINLMKGAIQLADLVTTVSPTYAEELKYPEYSHGMHYILHRNSSKLMGILNGIDYDYYNPQKDEEIYTPYTSTSLSGKAKNKAALLQELGLREDTGAPLLAVITRLAEHKGIDLIKRIIKEVLDETDACLVVLGTGEKQYEEFFSSLSGDYPGRVATILAYNKALSKKIYAGADIFLMPSLSEPCGLAQMIASRYGTVPITRETGGLYDSIKGYYELNNRTYGNGFTFKNYNAHELKDRIIAAISLHNDKERWKKLVRKVMKEDFSWNKSAQKYIEMYKSL